MAGRVIVDAYGYYQTNNIVKPQLRQLVSPEEDDAQADSSSENSPSSDEENDCDSSLSDEGNDCDSPVVNGPDMTAAKSLNKAITRCEVLDGLTDDQCLLATPWLRGLDLKTKEWGTNLTL